MQHKSNLITKFFFIFCFILSLFSSLFLTNPNDSVLAQEPTPTPEEEPRIVGGGPASPGEYPWQVALIGSDSDNEFYSGNGYQFCGGSILNEYWVITAAHCVTENNGDETLPSSIDIVVGLYDLATPASGYQRIDVSQIIRHPLYNTNNFDNDIALIGLSTPITLGGSGATATAIVSLASPAIGSLTGYTSWVSGWGLIDATPPTYDTELYEVDLPIISNATCSLYWSGIIDGNLCAGLGTGKDSCSGDSGGPLVIYENNQAILVGIVSSGSGDCEDTPGIYTRVSYYRTWIDAYISPNQVSSIMRANTNPTNQASINFNVTFSNPVTGVDSTDFTLTTSGVSGAVIVGEPSGTGSSYTVTVNTGSGSGSGTIRLDLIDNDSILDSFSAPLGGVGISNGNFTSGEIYTIDKTPPTVTFIECAIVSCTSNMLNASYLVTFSENVIGVDVTDFTLNTTGVAGATVSNVSGSGNTRVVSVNTGQGDGTIELEFIDNDSVIDLATNPTSAGYTDGQTYNIDKPELKAPILRSPRSGGATNDTTPNFIWQRLASASSYEIQIDNNSDFSSVEVTSDGIIVTNYTSIALAEGTYYWRVRANDVSDAPGKWSIVRTITIDITPPAAPILVTPAGTLSTRTVTFRWQSVTDAMQYRLIINKDDDIFSDPDYTFTLRTLSRRMTLPEGEYYWCVEARDALGNWGECITGTQFEINLP